MLVGLLIVAVLAIWVYQDAVSRDERQPIAWAIATFLLAIVALPVWLIKRPAKGSNQTRPCPYCAEAIQRQAVLCRFCSRAVDPETTAYAPPGSGMSTGFKWTVGVIALAIALFIALVILPGVTAPTRNPQQTTALSELGVATAV